MRNILPFSNKMEKYIHVLTQRDIYMQERMNQYIDKWMVYILMVF